MKKEHGKRPNDTAVTQQMHRYSSAYSVCTVTQGIIRSFPFYTPLSRCRSALSGNFSLRGPVLLYNKGVMDTSDVRKTHLGPLGVTLSEDRT